MKTVLIAFCALLLLGCDLPPVVDEQQHDIGYGGSFRTKEITLGDGTRCVVVNINRGGGISCDWK